MIDYQYGAWDPGRTGTVGENEKDINLKIAGKLQAYLEQSGATVIITRNEDAALSSDKREDMRIRKDIINEGKGDILLSVHQNSYPQEAVRGGQVFYLKGSEEGEALAKAVQAQLVAVLDPENHRVAKPDATYYILKNTKMPAVIVECGFLSNRKEEALLNTDEYQEKVAWAIYLGIMDYFNGL